MIARPGRALAAAGLADEPERLAAGDLERDAIHGPDVADVALADDPVADREPDLEVLDPQERHAAGGGRGTGRGRRARPQSSWKIPRRRGARARVAAAGRRPTAPIEMRPLLGLDRGDQALEVVGRADPVPGPDLVDHAGRRRGRHEARAAAAVPATASSAVGWLWQAIRWVAAGPVMTTGVPAIDRRSRPGCPSSRRRGASGSAARTGSRSGRGACPAAGPRSG